MPRNVPRPRILLGALGLAQIVSWGTIYYGFSLFVLPMQTSLGWSLPLINGALTVGLLVAGICAYPVGMFIDRHGGRMVMTAASLAASVLFVAWSYIDSPWQFYAVWVGFGLCMAGALYEPLFVVLTDYFRADARRAITALTLIAGFASTVFIPLIETLLMSIPWREVLVLLALANLAICVPVHWYWLPDRRGPIVDPAAEAHAKFAPVPVAERLRDPVFWGLTLWFTSYAATGSSLMFQIVPYLKSVGVETATLLLAVALVGPAQVAGRLVLMVRHAGDAGRIGALTTTLMPLGLLVLIYAPPTLSWLALFAITFGIANGISTILRGVVPGEWLGQAHFGRTMGLLAVPMTVAAALAPLATAAIWSATGNAQSMPWTVLMFALLGVVGYWLAVGARYYRTKIAKLTHHK